MKFHLKMTFSMLALLSLLFGIGGSMLISVSFRESLEREEAAAFGNYRMAWGTLQIVNGLEPYLDQTVLSQTMEQLYQQNSTFWTNIQLSTAENVIYKGGGIQTTAFQMNETVEAPAPGECLFYVAEDTSVSAISKCRFSPKWNVVFYRAAYRCYTALYTTSLAGLKPVKP